MKLMKAIIGDICGSLYEFNREKVDSYPTEIMLEECHFTDDTVWPWLMPYYIIQKIQTLILF